MNVYTYTYIIYSDIYLILHIRVYIYISTSERNRTIAFWQKQKWCEPPNNAPPSHGRCPVWRRIMSCLASLGRATLKKLNTLKTIWINMFDIVGSWHILIHTDTNFVITETYWNPGHPLTTLSYTAPFWPRDSVRIAVWRGRSFSSIHGCRRQPEIWGDLDH